MADPHNPERYGETWPQHKIDAYLVDLGFLRDLVTLSGGFAWHFLSPADHVEYKHAHDHKDVDLYVPSANVGETVARLNLMGYRKVTTRYDRLPSKEDFRRYERTVTRYVCHGKVSDSPHQCFCLTDSGDRECFTDEFRLTIDFFVGDHPTLTLTGGWKVIRPDVLLTFYGDIHSSDKCWAVVAASKLLEAGELPENLADNKYLMACPDRPIWFCTKCGWSGQFPEEMTGQHAVCGRSSCNYVTQSLGTPTYLPKAENAKRVTALLEDFCRKWDRPPLDKGKEARSQAQMRNFQEAYGGKTQTAAGGASGRHKPKKTRLRRRKK